MISNSTPVNEEEESQLALLAQQMSCSHTETVEGHWEAREDFNQEEYDLGGFETDEMEWIPGYEKPTVVDINIHQYKCTKCSKVINY